MGIANRRAGGPNGIEMASSWIYVGIFSPFPAQVDLGKISNRSPICPFRRR